MNKHNLENNTKNDSNSKPTNQNKGFKRPNNNDQEDGLSPESRKKKRKKEYDAEYRKKNKEKTDE